MIRKVTVRRVPSHPPLSCRTEGGVTAALFLQRRRLAKAAMTSDLPLAGEMSGRTEGGVLSRQRFGFFCTSRQ
ncbi:MAG: hypothetical protein E5W96_12710 [Mesorhizobium sp.]|nr:MAG: hypothetical protein E5W96_12710 [Mesorhizobium sp.]